MPKISLIIIRQATAFGHTMPAVKRLFIAAPIVIYWRRHLFVAAAAMATRLAYREYFFHFDKPYLPMRRIVLAAMKPSPLRSSY